MKKAAFSVLIFFFLFTLTALPAAAYPDPAVKEVYANDELEGYSLPYNLILPANYDESGSYPVILLLHGAGERGNDNEKQMKNAVDNLYKTRPELMADVIMLVPQCPAEEQWVDWPWTDGNYSTDEIPESKALSTAIKLLGEVLDNYACDRDRVYLMGLSMGGFGTWDALVRHGELFAAAVPICGGGDVSKADILKEIPIWCVHGTADQTVPFAGTEALYNAITAAGGDRITFDAVQDGTHGVWNHASTDGDLIDWMFEQNLTLRYPHETEPESEAAEAESTDDTQAADNTQAADPAPAPEGTNPLPILLAIAAIVIIGAAAALIITKRSNK